MVDRIVDGEYAVLLVDPDEREEVLPLSSLPRDVQEGTWYKVRIDQNGDIELLESLENETAQRKARIESKLERLRRRSKKRS